jgi:Icc-related predicted phosphoesterase
MFNILRHPFTKPVIILVLVSIATLWYIQLFTQVSFDYESFSFTIQTKITPAGGTRIAIPPVGELFFKSHLTPWQIKITLNEIDFSKLEQQLKEMPPKQQWLKLFQTELLKAVLSLFAMALGWGLLGALTVLLVFRIFPKNRLFWYGIGLSLAVIFSLIGATVATYDQSAAERPQYQGVLESAPWAMNLVTMGLDNLSIIGDNLRKVSSGLPLLYKQAGQIQNIGEVQSDLTILHVSDIHNNPAAFDFITELVANFKINFIIDTGDVTDYGTALEAETLTKIGRYGVPYVFIPGNHDSPLIIERLKQLKNVKILSKGILELSGITIAAIADPASQSYNSDVSDSKTMEEYKNQLTELVRKMDITPTIVAVHNRILAGDLIGKVPLVLHGHDHQYRLSHQGDTIVNDAGTTGAAGIRGLTPKGVPYSAAILYWKKSRDQGYRLNAIDSIKINGVEGRLTIERHTFQSREKS